jgi:four helix bundle protein
MARLQESFLERVEALCDRVLEVADAFERARVSRRIIDQVVASGTSVGANVFEADEAMSRADFVKCLCIATKELNETRFWLRMAGRRNWVRSARLTPLLDECGELKRVFGSMISRTKQG